MAESRKGRHIFISYSLRDMGYVNRLEAELQANGYEVWRDRSDLNVGDTWVAKIEEALNDAWAVVVVQSPDSKESRWVFNEVEYAQNKGIPVIPILLEGEPWFGFLHKQYFDMRGKEHQRLPDEFYEDLLRFAPPYPIHKEINADKLISNAADRISLIPQLEEIARNPRSSRGYAAQQLLSSLSQDSDQHIRSAALAARQKLYEEGILRAAQAPQKKTALVPKRWRLALIGLGVVLVVGVIIVALAARNDRETAAREDSAPLLLVDIVGGDLRAGPGYDYRFITTVRDAEVPIIGVSPDGEWYRVNYEGNEGWLSATLFRTRGDLSAVPVIEVPPPAQSSGGTNDNSPASEAPPAQGSSETDDDSSASEAPPPAQNAGETDDD